MSAAMPKAGDNLDVAPPSSADFQSAVSQDCILPGVGQSERVWTDLRPADCKSAIQPVRNLRHDAANYADVYRFLAEVLLYPEERDVQRLSACAQATGRAAPEWGDTVESLLANPQLGDCDLYLETFEIGAKCPLYLGHYLFEEPTNCRGAALSGRNGYMIQLKNLYRHFGFELCGGELPDYLPLMLDFLALSAGHPSPKHRRLLVKQFLLPALPPFTKQLRAANNVYAPIAPMLETLLTGEVEMSAAPESKPPNVSGDRCPAN